MPSFVLFKAKETNCLFRQRIRSCKYMSATNDWHYAVSLLYGRQRYRTLKQSIRLQYPHEGLTVRLMVVDKTTFF